VSARSATQVTAPDGATAIVQRLGAQVTSWIPAGGGEQLFLASQARLGEKAVKGGVPVLFPQFADLGPLPMHGFARDLPWTPAGETTEGGMRRASYVLNQPEGWGTRWPHPFRLELTVAIGGRQLAVSLTVHNTGGRTWYFTGGLHTYLGVADIAAARLDGLQGRIYRDKTRGNAESSEAAQALEVTQETDRVYLGAAGPLVLREPGREVVITTAGFPDAVVWNPWAGSAQRFPDFDADDYRRMLCVEAVVIGSPPILEPGQHWTGTQTLTWSDT
jgi:glucose-6-phosphate 1-epimerase